jgi:methylmalonyl-CoA mutase
MYQRSKIQDESLQYESKKSSGELKITGVNFWLDKEQKLAPPADLRRSSDQCKKAQVEQIKFLHSLRAEQRTQSLNDLRQCLEDGSNSFAALMDSSKVCTLGEITEVLAEMGGLYRRNM